MAYIFDSNIIIKILNNDPEIISKFSHIKDYYLTSISIGELYYGAEKSNRKSENISTIEKIISSSKVLTINPKTAREYGKIKTYLKQKGSPIPENDIWIVSICKAHNCKLITTDKHFDKLSDLIDLYGFDYK